jgi:signal transduction histidine kinase
MLRAFSNMFATSLDLVQKHWEREHEAAAVGQETALEAVTHNLGSRLTTLIGLFDDFRAIESDVPQVRRLNEKFKLQLEQILKLPGRAKDLVRAESVRRERFELIDYVLRFLAARMPADFFQVDGAKQLWVLADPARLSDLLSELLANSQQFKQPPGDLRVTITARAESDKMLRLIYRDNGPGVPLEHKSRIFEVYFSRRRGKPSTGIGLSVVSCVVRAHGGTIAETGTFGKGAEFTIMMPICDDLPEVTAPLCSESSS